VRSLVGGSAVESPMVGRAGMTKSVLAFLDGRPTGGMLIIFQMFVLEEGRSDVLCRYQ